MLKHYPDKPYTRSPDDIASWDSSGNYICQQKCDGWRIEVIKALDGSVHYYSRHNKDLTGDIEDNLKQQMQPTLQMMPPGSQLDGEWLSRRSHSKVAGAKPGIILFDVIRWDRRWLLQTLYEKRWALLQEIAVPADNISPALTAEPGSFVEFYENQKSIAHSEGIVVKDKRSKLIGDRNDSKKNPRWFKVKYRGGLDGEERLDYLR